MANTSFLSLLRECPFSLSIKRLVGALHSQEVSCIARVKLLNFAIPALFVVVN